MIANYTSVKESNPAPAISIPQAGTAFSFIESAAQLEFAVVAAMR